MGEVFRAFDRLTGQTVALKRVLLSLPAASPTPSLADSGLTSLGQAPTLAPQALASGPLSGSARAASPITAFDAFAAAHSAQLHTLRVHLTQEFRTLAGLRHPHIVSVLDYGFDRDQQPYFTMEYLADAEPLDKAARGQPPSVQVSLLLQVLQALSYLHRRGVLHRDLKPGNILVVSSDSGLQVKLVDFGLALLSQDLRSRSAEIAGTLGYMAPEVLTGGAPSAASDLFAVGVMAHELLVGAHPLGAHETRVLIRELLKQSPIFSADDRLSAPLSAVLRRALDRSPHERFPDAAVFGKELARAAGIPIPVETTEIRESFLQAAAFVARETELGTLAQALGEASVGSGAVWLIGGESGVGKSRLLDELRTLGLVRGTRVVRGQAVSTGGSAYQVWQGVLRPLCLDADLDDLDAGVLRIVVPDIGALLDAAEPRPVPEPPVLDPQSAQARFLLTVEKLLHSQLTEKSEPLLVLLEDLHWADPGSLTVLLRLMRSVPRLPLLIVGSYRHDERPELPGELPGARLLKLQRLRTPEIVALSTSMLGESGRRRDVVALLERETEGNAFFIVEVLRALAEEVGALGRIGSGPIPSRILAGGVQAVLLRRLGRVPASSRPLLCAAATLSREPDLAVLRALPEEISAQLDEQLAACAAASVLEVHEDRWRFIHDKLREALLQQLSQDEREGWHRRIGEALERAYAPDPGAHAAALFHHFEQAGDWARALPYGLQAGERALRDGAVQDAVVHLERVTALLDRAGAAPTERGRALKLLCRAYYGAGRPEECAQTLERMIAEAGHPPPRSQPALLASLGRLTLQHVAFRLAPKWAPLIEERQSIDRALLDEASDATLTTVGAVAWTRSPLQLTRHFLAWLVITERLGDPARMAAAYNSLGVMLSMSPIKGLSDRYLAQAQTLFAQTASAPPGTIEAIKGGEAFVHTSRGEWDLARQCLKEAMASSQRRGDSSQELFGLANMMRIEIGHGDHYALAALLPRMEELAQRLESAQYLCMVEGLRGFLYLRTGEFAAARQCIARAREHLFMARDRSFTIFMGGHSALCALRMDERVEARRWADEALQSLRSAPPFGNLTVEGASPVIETYLALLQRSSSDTERADLDLRLKQAIATLYGLAMTFPVCRPRTLYWRGRYAALHGHSRLADWLLRRALASAEQRGMAFEEALIHQALADLAELRGERGSAAAQRNKARLLFERTGARWYAAQLDLRDTPKGYKTAGSA